MMERRLYDKAADIAVLRQLLLQRSLWSDMVTASAIAWLGWDRRTSHVGALSTGMLAVLRSWCDQGIVERRPGDCCTEFRLSPKVTIGDIKRLTGGIDPTRISEEECLELDTPAVEGLRRVEFEQFGFMKAPTAKSRLERAHKQCPSVFELGTRIKIIAGAERRKKEKSHGRAAGSR
jgi:hypothetical protein